MHFARYCLALLVLVGLAGCKATSVDLQVSSQDIHDAKSGKEVFAKFRAEFSFVGNLDEDNRRSLGRIESVAKQFMHLDDFEVSKADVGIRVRVEGRLPVVSAANSRSVDAGSPWAVVLRSHKLGVVSKYPIALTVEPTTSFESFKAKLSAVNFMLSPDPYQPTRIRLSKSKGQGLSVLAAGALVDGKAHALAEIDIIERVSFTFKGGAYDDIGATLFVALMTQ
jgi:hypothetical protein